MDPFMYLALHHQRAAELRQAARTAQRAHAATAARRAARRARRAAAATPTRSVCDTTCSVPSRPWVPAAH
jgi:septal ring factor EnvC (AmiA/AmiB activator)